MTLWRWIAAWLLMMVAALPAIAQQQAELTRRAALGVQAQPVEGPPGVLIGAITPGLTAAEAGLRVGDVITALNGQTITDGPGLTRAASTLRAGAGVRFTFVRGARTREARTSAIARPPETFDGGTVSLGAVSFRGGMLRDILVRPTRPAPGAPVIFLIQGYPCGSVEGPTPAHPYRALAQSLIAQGLAVYRIEKAGVGDSLGGPDCMAGDFAAELDGFEAGLDALVSRHGVAPGRIVLFGHSMGGIQAPLIAARRGGLAGVAVMGTAVRNWHDYMIELYRLQGFPSAAADPAESEAMSEALRPVFDRIFNEATPLARIADDNADHRRLLREALGWNGEEQILARDISYWRQIADLRLAAAWRDTEVPVLTIYGESDFAAIDDRDHRLIVDIVNHYRPGTARFVPLARTGHGFGLDGTRDEARAGNIAAGGGAPPGPFNPEMGKVLAAWVLELP